MGQVLFPWLGPQSGLVEFSVDLHTLDSCCARTSVRQHAMLCLVIVGPRPASGVRVAEHPGC